MARRSTSDRDQHDGGHHEGALRRDLRARRRRYRPPPASSATTAADLLDRPGSASAGDSARTPRTSQKTTAGDQRHVQPGDRDDVVEAGSAQRLVGVVRDERRACRSPGRRRRRRSRRRSTARMRSVSALRSVRIDRRRTQRQIAALRPGCRRRDAPERVADGADAVEVGVAREVVAAGPRRLRRRQQPRLQRRRGRRR